MANTNDTLSRVQSKPEKMAQWLFSTSANWRHFLGFLLIVALTIISIRFNYELGKLSAVDETSKELLPAGYALLDLCCLFLSGFVGIKSRSLTRKLIAWGWFSFLLCLSLWAAASFTLSVDHRLANKDLEHAISQKSIEVESLNAEVDIWRQNVAEAVQFKTKHQNTLKEVQSRQAVASDELHSLESSLVAPTMAIYHKASPYTPLDTDTLSLMVRLLWAGAMTLSPLVIVLLVCAELQPSGAQPTTSPTIPPESKKRRFKDFLDSVSSRMEAFKERGKNALRAKHKTDEVTVKPSSQDNLYLLPANDIEPINGHNQHTPTVDLNGLKRAKSWLEKQKAGRVTKARLSASSKVYGRDGINRIISELIDSGLLVRLGNGQISKPQSLALISITQ